jgi:hypothetical protein
VSEGDPALKSTYLRYLVTFSAVIIGIGWAAWDFSTIASTLPKPNASPSGQMPPEVSRAIFDACVTFYGCVYGVGKFGYRLLGRQSEAEELRRWSSWHMRVLNGAGGVWLCASAWQSFRLHEIIRPAAIIGAALSMVALVSTVLAVRRAVQVQPADT